MKISDVMTPAEKIVFGTEDTSLAECRQIMLKNNYRHLPILENNSQRPLGQNCPLLFAHLKHHLIFLFFSPCRHH